MVRPWLKYAALVFFPGLLSLGILCYLDYQDSFSRELNSRSVIEQSRLTMAQGEFLRQLQEVGRDAQLLSQSVTVSTGNPVEEDASAFSGFMKLHPQYASLQVIDLSGNRLFGLSRQGENFSILPAMAANEQSNHWIKTLNAVPAGQVQVEMVLSEDGKPLSRLFSSFAFSARSLGENGAPARVVRLLYQTEDLSSHALFGNQLAPVWLLGADAQLLQSGKGRDDSPLMSNLSALWQAMHQRGLNQFETAGGELFYFHPFSAAIAMQPGRATQVALSFPPEQQSWFLVSRLPAESRQVWEQNAFDHAQWMLLMGGGAWLLISLLVAYRFSALRHGRFDVDKRKRFLGGLLDRMPIACLLVDSQGKPLRMNAKWRQYCALSDEQGDDAPWRQAVHVDDQPQVNALWEKVIQEKRPGLLEFRLAGGVGVMWVRCTSLPLRDDSEEVFAFILVMMDITAQKSREAAWEIEREKADQTQAELNALMSNAGEAIAVIDAQAKLRIVSQAFVDVLQTQFGIGCQRGDSLFALLEQCGQDVGEFVRLGQRALQGTRVQGRHSCGGDGLERRVFDLLFTPQYASGGELDGVVLLLRDMSAQARAELTSRRSEEFLGSVIESSLDGVAVLAVAKDDAGTVTDFRVLNCNQMLLDLWQCKRSECQGLLLGQILPPVVRARLLEMMLRVFESRISLDQEILNSEPVAAACLYYQAVPQSEGVTLTVRDLSQSRLLEQRLIETEARSGAILASIQEGILILNASGVILSVNRACEHIFACSAGGFLNRRISFLFPTMTELLQQGELNDELLGNAGFGLEVFREARGKRQDGVLIDLEVSFKPLMLGAERFYVVTMQDITERKAYELRMQQNIAAFESLQESLNESNDQLLQANRELLRLAHLDGLTGLANRRFFDQTLHNEWSRALRNRQRLSLIMLDVDHFKRYNDGYGHQSGDECLKAIAVAITSSLRRPTDFAARYGGEEFVIILPATDEEGAELVANCILEEIHNQSIPHEYSTTSQFVTVSAGVATALPAMGQDVEWLISSADQTLYLAKQRGRDRVLVASRE